jgi:hypothetical protein
VKAERRHCLLAINHHIIPCAPGVGSALCFIDTDILLASLYLVASTGGALILPLPVTSLRQISKEIN